MAFGSLCSFAAFSIFFSTHLGRVGASSFLSRAQDGTEEPTEAFRTSILDEIEMMLHGHGQPSMDERLVQIEEMLRTTFKALPKNKFGKLGDSAVRYSLHSYFVQRHAWFVRGVANLGESLSGSSPVGILQDRVDDFVQGAFEMRLGTDGLDLRDMALLAATYENLVHKEAMQRLNSTYRMLGVDSSQELELSQMDTVLDTYMIGYTLRLNFTALKPKQMDLVWSRIQSIYPAWDETQGFLRDLRSKKSFHRNFFSFSDVANMVDEVGDQYGRWQDKECHLLKAQLLEIEDRSIGTNGSGRVRISDFYGSAVRDGNWQFSETIDYLSELGALDASDPDVPRVIIPNYINSPSNCLAGSRFYSVCCINECEALMDHIEHHFAAPSASPSDIAEFVATLPSSSVSRGRTLPPSLLARLDEMSLHHGGNVPLHGRFFAQWMHHAYPRECPYPHIAGSTKPKTPQEYMRETSQKAVLTQDDMKKAVNTSSVPSTETGEIGSDECTVWSDHEELYVAGVADVSAPVQWTRALLQLVRPVLYLAVAVAAALAVVRLSVSGTVSAAKACDLGRGKDVFV